MVLATGGRAQWPPRTRGTASTWGAQRAWGGPGVVPAAAPPGAGSSTDGAQSALVGRDTVHVGRSGLAAACTWSMQQ